MWANPERRQDIPDSSQQETDERGWSLPAMSIAWLMSRPYVPTVIAGADQVAHIEENVRALDVTFSEADLAEIDRLTLVDEDRTRAPVFRMIRG